jgi:hypothetical protein
MYGALCHVVFDIGKVGTVQIGKVGTVQMSFCFPQLAGWLLAQVFSRRSSSFLARLDSRFLVVASSWIWSEDKSSVLERSNAE